MRIAAVSDYPSGRIRARGDYRRPPFLLRRRGVVRRSLFPFAPVGHRLSLTSARGSFPPHRFALATWGRILKRSLSKAGLADGERYSPNCFRRGVGDEIIRSVSTLASIMRAGGGRPADIAHISTCASRKNLTYRTFHRRISPSLAPFGWRFLVLRIADPRSPFSLGASFSFPSRSVTKFD